MRERGMNMDGTLKYAEHKLDEAIKQGEPDETIAYWRGYRDCAKALKQTCNKVATGCKPLTLEQLREKVDKPVYLYIYDTALSSGWEILKAVTKDKIIFRGWNTVYVPISSMGKCFDLYAYPPIHIDRGAWKPCMLCKNPKSLNLFLDMNCRYCPKCGRPLTEEAWAELEKRLRWSKV